MSELYEIPKSFTFRPNTGWKRAFRAESKLNGAAPTNWDDITVKAYLCNPSDLTVIKKAVTVIKGAAGNLDASLTEVDVAGLAAGDVALVFLYKVTGDVNAYPLAIAGSCTVGGGLPAW